jgi:outer membrane protein assembly factor BamB
MCAVSRVLFALSVFAASAVHAADDWPSFRGPKGQGHASDAHLPAAWSESENIQWKTALAGRAWSSPVIADGVCWMTTAVVKEAPGEAKPKGAGESGAKKEATEKPATEKPAAEANRIESVRLGVVAVDLETGTVRHEIELFERPHPETIHKLNSYASPTPVVKAGRVYCHFGNLGTAAVDTRTGEVLWKTRLPAKHGVGPGSSPVIYEQLLIVPNDGMETQSVVALDLATGQEVWKTSRPKMKGDNGDYHKAFSTPLLIDERLEPGAGGRPQLVAVGPQWVVAYNPKNGSEIWKVHYGDGFSNAPCPVYARGVVFICTGFMTPELWAIRTDGEGDVTNTHVLWQVKKQVPTMSSPILVGDVLYMISEQGVVTCVDQKTGKVNFQKRIPGTYSSSPLIGDGKLLFSSREGDMTVVAAEPAWRQIAQNRLHGEILASPAVWHDSWIVRTNSHLYRIGESQSK